MAGRTTDDTPVRAMSARGQVRAWVQRTVADEDEVMVPVLREQALRHFGGDQVFMQQLFAEAVGDMIYDLALSVMAQSRGRQNVIELGDAITSKDGITRRTLKLRQQWNLWREHAGDRHYLLLNMTRDQLLLAARERRARAGRELDVAELWERLAEMMIGEEKVGDKFTEDQIEEINANIRSVRMAN